MEKKKSNTAVIAVVKTKFMADGETEAKIIEVEILEGNIVYLPNGERWMVPTETYNTLYKKYLEEKGKKENNDATQTEQSAAESQDGGVNRSDADLSDRETVAESKPQKSNKKQTDQRWSDEDEDEEESFVIGSVPVDEDEPEGEPDEDTFSDDSEEIGDNDLDETSETPKWPRGGHGVLIGILIAIIALLITGFGLIYFGVIPFSGFNRNTANPTGTVAVLQIVTDMKQGDVIEESSFQMVTVTQEEYIQLSATTYVTGNGTSETGSLVLWENRDAVIGKFATRDMRSGKYITMQDYSGQKVVAERTFIDVEIDGQTVQVPVEVTQLNGNTRVKIVAMIYEDGSTDAIMISLGEFVLEDRTLKDIFDSAGQSILEQLANGKQIESPTEETAAEPAA